MSSMVAVTRKGLAAFAARKGVSTLEVEIAATARIRAHGVGYVAPRSARQQRRRKAALTRAMLRRGSVRPS